MVIGISDLVNVAGFVLGLLNSPSPKKELPQCVEQPKAEVQQITLDRQRVYENPFQDDRDYCSEVSAEQWERVGQSLYDAFEGTRSKNEICKSLIASQKYVQTIHK